MKNKFLALLGILTLSFGVAGAVTACQGDDEPPAPPATEYGFTLKDGLAHIVWEGLDESLGYIIEKSPSRFGEYELMDVVLTTEYVTDDIYSYYRVGVMDANGAVEDYLYFSYDAEVFGENTFIFSPNDDPEKIQEAFDDFYVTVDGTKEGAEGRARGEFSEERFSAFFKSGEYDLNVNVGYYMTVAGLDASPDGVTVSNISADAPISLCNFWRTVENLSVGGDMLWSVSQATSLRRVHVKGNLNLSGPGRTTSGGFLADTKVDGNVNSGSQQQWLSRNSEFGAWNGGVWNMAFVGVEGNVPKDNWSSAKYTVIDESEALREKPYLTFDEDFGYRVFVPEATNGASGVSWSGAARGRYIPLSEFYVARSDRDTAATINAALAEGKHLFLTAGIYELDEPIFVGNSDAVVIGAGLATLRPTDKNKDTLMRIADVDGVTVCGILFDAGNTTKTLFEAGEAGCEANHSANPATFSDLFFRIGGAKETNTSVDACVVINSDNVVGDNFWIWRADHWDGVGWGKNAAKNGIIINGDNVTFYGLFVEHFSEYQTLWNGENGVTFFYQSELPYDVPSQGEWLSHGGTVNGFASYKVADGVQNHRAYAMGVYAYLRDAAVKLENAIETPDCDGVYLYHLITVWLSGNEDSAINHVVNGVGGAAVKGGTISTVEKFEGKTMA